MRYTPCMFDEYCSYKKRFPNSSHLILLLRLFGCEWAGLLVTFWTIAGSFWSTGSSTQLLNSSSLRIFFWKAQHLVLCVQEQHFAYSCNRFCNVYLFWRFEVWPFALHFDCYRILNLLWFPKKHQEQSSTWSHSWFLGWSATVGRIQILF